MRSRFHWIMIASLFCALWFLLETSGDRKTRRYRESKSLSAASTVGPEPAIPSLRFGTREAIHASPCLKSSGRHSADGLAACAAKYDFMLAIAACFVSIMLNSIQRTFRVLMRTQSYCFQA